MARKKRTPEERLQHDLLVYVISQDNDPEISLEVVAFMTDIFPDFVEQLDKNCAPK